MWVDLSPIAIPNGKAESTMNRALWFLIPNKANPRPNKTNGETNMSPIELFIWLSAVEDDRDTTTKVFGRDI